MVVKPFFFFQEKFQSIGKTSFAFLDSLLQIGPRFSTLRRAKHPPKCYLPLTKNDKFWTAKYRPPPQLPFIIFAPRTEINEKLVDDAFNVIFKFCISMHR